MQSSTLTLIRGLIFSIALGGELSFCRRGFFWFLTTTTTTTTTTTNLEYFEYEVTGWSSLVRVDRYLICDHAGVKQEVRMYLPAQVVLNL